MSESNVPLEDVYLCGVTIIARGEHECRDSEAYREAARMLRAWMVRWYYRREEPAA